MINLNAKTISCNRNNYQAFSKIGELLLDAGVVLSPVILLAGTSSLEMINLNYNRFSDTISSLVWGPFGWFQVIMFGLFAVLFLTMACRLAKSIPVGRASRIGILALALIGVCFIIIAVCPTQPEGSARTLPNAIHDQSARFMTLLFPVAVLALGQGFKQHAIPHGLKLSNTLVGLVALALWVVCAALVLIGIPLLGLMERLMMINCLVWIELISLNVLGLRGILRMPALGKALEYSRQFKAN